MGRCVLKILGVNFTWGWIEWGEYRPDDYQYYIAYYPNWLNPDIRYWGFSHMYYDGPHVTFGFWYFNVSWSTYWSKMPTGYWD